MTFVPGVVAVAVATLNLVVVLRAPVVPGAAQVFVRRPFFLGFLSAGFAVTAWRLAIFPARGWWLFVLAAVVTSVALVVAMRRVTRDGRRRVTRTRLLLILAAGSLLASRLLMGFMDEDDPGLVGWASAVLMALAFVLGAWSGMRAFREGLARDVAELTEGRRAERPGTDGPGTEHPRTVDPGGSARRRPS